MESVELLYTETERRNLMIMFSGNTFLMLCRAFMKGVATIVVAALFLLYGSPLQQSATGSEISSLLAPSGVLRVAINTNNAILAHLDENGEPGGISVDLARELARQLGLDVTLHTVAGAVRSVEAVVADEVDLGFFAIDPERGGAGIVFTAPYILIEGWFLVREDSPFTDNASVDQPGVRIAVGQGSAYDLFLTRTLNYATLERGPTTPEVVNYFVSNNLDVAANIRQQLEYDMERHPGMRLLPERFMVIEQAMGIPSSRDEAATQFLNNFLQEVRTNGFLAGLAEKHGITGITIP
jgi:polar amino acid transport system substrate-binding protein